MGRLAFYPLMVSVGGLIKQIAYPFLPNTSENSKNSTKVFYFKCWAIPLPMTLDYFPFCAWGLTFSKGKSAFGVSFPCLMIWHIDTWQPNFWYFLGLPQLKTFLPQLSSLMSYTSIKFRRLERMGLIRSNPRSSVPELIKLHLTHNRLIILLLSWDQYAVFNAMNVVVWKRSFENM